MTRTDRMPRVWRPVWVEQQVGLDGVKLEWQRVPGGGPFRTRGAALKALDAIQAADPKAVLRITPLWQPS